MLIEAFFDYYPLIQLFAKCIIIDNIINSVISALLM